MELLNCEENWGGDYVQVAVATPMARDGINLKNVQFIHLVGASWNESEMIQATYRGIRQNSHLGIRKGMSAAREELMRYLLQGRADSRKDEVESAIRDMDKMLSEKLQVSVMRHCAILDPNKYPQEWCNTVDCKMYSVAENKDVAISRVMRMVKECSINCQTDYERNVWPTDIGVPKDNAYTDQPLLSVDAVSKVVDSSKYYMHASSSILREIMVQAASELVSKKLDRISLSEVMEGMNYKFSLSLFNQCMMYSGRDCFSEQIQGLYNIPYKLVFDTQYFYMRPYGEFNTGRYYSNTIYSIGKLDMEELKEIMIMNDLTVTRALLSPYTMSMSSFSKILEGSNYMGKVSLGEELLYAWGTINSLVEKGEMTEDDKLAVYEGESPIPGKDICAAHLMEKVDLVKSQLKRFYFIFKEPVHQLNKHYRELQTKRIRCRPVKMGNPDHSLAHESSRRGKESENKLFKKKYLKVSKKGRDLTAEQILADNDRINKDESVVVVHILFALCKDSTKYSYVSKINKGECLTRVLNLDQYEEGWRNVSQDDFPVYNEIIQKLVWNAVSPSMQLGFHGVISDNVFRLHNMAEVTNDTPSSSVNRRNYQRGLTCKDYNKDLMINIMATYDIYPPNFRPCTTKQWVKEDIKKIWIELMKDHYAAPETMLATKQENFLYCFYAWQASQLERPKICDVLQNWMKKTGRLITY